MATSYELWRKKPNLQVGSWDPGGECNAVGNDTVIALSSSCKVPGDEGELEECRDVDLSQAVGSAVVIG